MVVAAPAILSLPAPPPAPAAAATAAVVADTAAATAGESGKHINIKVNNANGESTHFKLSKTTALRKVMDAYLQRHGIQAGTARFLHDGQRVVETDTPASRGMEEGDAIDVLISQTGGATVVVI
jgi:small ubiquitin-related modifier